MRLDVSCESSAKQRIRTKYQALFYQKNNEKIFKTVVCCSPGPGCSKLTTSLVNVSLKFQTLISKICQYFLLKKCEKLLHCKSFSHFSTKNISVFGYEVVIHLTS